MTEKQRRLRWPVVDDGALVRNVILRDALYANRSARRNAAAARVPLRLVWGYVDPVLGTAGQPLRWTSHPYARRQVVANPEFERFLVRREAAARAYVRGDPGGVDALAIPSGGATFHSPRGDTVTDAEAVRKRYRMTRHRFRQRVLEQHVRSGEIVHHAEAA